MECMLAPEGNICVVFEANNTHFEGRSSLSATHGSILSNSLEKLKENRLAVGLAKWDSLLRQEFLKLLTGL